MTPRELGFSDQEIVNAMVRANADRGRLAYLLKTGWVKRFAGPYESRHPKLARPFIRDIEERAKSPVNLAIRPKKRKKG